MSKSDVGIERLGPDALPALCHEDRETRGTVTGSLNLFHRCEAAVEGDVLLYTEVRDMGNPVVAVISTSLN